MVFLLVAAALIAGWVFYCYDHNGFGAKQMRGMTHLAIAEYYRIAFLDNDADMQEMFENHWGDAYGTDQWRKFEIRVLEYMVRKGDSRAKERLGLLLMHGEGAQCKKGLEYMEQAANEGSVSAMKSLALFYGMPSEYGGKAHDLEKEVYWYRRAADVGNAEALYQLHFNYATGEGVERNDDKAIECLEEAMKRGHQMAKIEYAKSYYGRVDKETYNPYKEIELLKSVLTSNDVEAICKAALELGVTFGGYAVFSGDKKVQPKEYENVEEALRYFHLAKRIEPYSNAEKWYRSLMINTNYSVDENIENQWVRIEDEILGIK